MPDFLGHDLNVIMHTRRHRIVRSEVTFGVMYDTL